MTRAPRSASCRVANGAAMACSSVTTVIPVSGLIACAPSTDLRSGVHRKPAFVVLGPQPHALAIRRRLATYVERIDVEQRPHGAKLVASHDGVRQLGSQQIEEQRRDQRPVDDQSGITLDLGNVLADRKSTRLNSSHQIISY